MRKENEAIKTKYTLQVQDLRRQLVTKKAFDEDESQREISRLKKELQFVQMQVYNTKRMKGMATGPSKENFDQNQPSSAALARADAQAKQELENENEILRSKIDQMDLSFADQTFTFSNDIVQHEHQEQCAICWDDHQPQQELVEPFTNGHWFHVQCIRECALVKKECPVCREVFGDTSIEPRRQNLINVLNELKIHPSI